MTRDVGEEIAAAWLRIQDDHAEEQVLARYRLALRAVQADPPADDPAWDEYDAAVAALAELREVEEEA